MGRVGLLCGGDGLPHLVAEPGFALRLGQEGEVLIPTFMFLYFAGWIGFSGRLYLEATRDQSKEIIIDVPLAMSLVIKGLSWPIQSVGLMTSNQLVEEDRNITVSPR